ncbi:hypothetical protein K0M31_001519 [Melipona bicolor]|uniref:Uncharacterized protein n=1 Tax=Melipona bicolor TaxID=60889 RepID=A0AA40GFN6_9HYME|nr:hypothetical protein K0M31_001519 [Melipona bicolor]
MTSAVRLSFGGCLVSNRTRHNYVTADARLSPWEKSPTFKMLDGEKQKRRLFSSECGHYGDFIKARCQQA